MPSLGKQNSAVTLSQRLFCQTSTLWPRQLAHVRGSWSAYAQLCTSSEALGAAGCLTVGVSWGTRDSHPWEETCVHSAFSRATYYRQMLLSPFSCCRGFLRQAVPIALSILTRL